jgi:hypothetical protein
MRNHRLIHSGVRAWACARCPRRFRIRSDLRTHARLKHPAHLAVLQVLALPHRTFARACVSCTPRTSPYRRHCHTAGIAALTHELCTCVSSTTRTSPYYRYCHAAGTAAPAHELHARASQVPRTLRQAAGTAATTHEQRTRVRLKHPAHFESCRYCRNHTRPAHARAFLSTLCISPCSRYSVPCRSYCLAPLPWALMNNKVIKGL